MHQLPRLHMYRSGLLSYPAASLYEPCPHLRKSCAILHFEVFKPFRQLWQLLQAAAVVCLYALNATGQLWDVP
jgi:hypothetical protein